MSEIDPRGGASPDVWLDAGMGLRSSLDHHLIVAFNDVYGKAARGIFDLSETFIEQGRVPDEVVPIGSETSLLRTSTTSWSMRIGDPESFPPQIVQTKYKHDRQGSDGVSTSVIYPDTYMYAGTYALWNRVYEGGYALPGAPIKSEHVVLPWRTPKLMSVVGAKLETLK